MPGGNLRQQQRCMYVPFKVIRQNNYARASALGAQTGGKGRGSKEYFNFRKQALP